MPGRGVMSFQCDRRVVTTEVQQPELLLENLLLRTEVSQHGLLPSGSPTVFALS